MVNTSSDGHGGRMSIVRRVYSNIVAKRIATAGLVAADLVGYLWDMERLSRTMSTDKVAEVHCHPNFRVGRGKRLDDRLFDWDTPYKDSFSLLDLNKNHFDLIDFKALRDECI